MAAVTIPESVVPGELYIPDGTDGPISVESAALPNGDDALRITEGTGTEAFQAFQDPSADHLASTNASAMSFWIRRNQAFDSGSTALSANSVSGSAINVGHRFLMGKGVANYASVPLAANRKLSWAWLTYNTAAIQFIEQGYIPGNNYYWLTSQVITLTEDVWHLVVLNREPAVMDSTILDVDNRGRHTVYRDSTLVGENNYSGWMPYKNTDGTEQFALGNPMDFDATAGGAAPGPAWDIAKLTFHSRNITPTEQFELWEAMRYS